MTAAPADGVVPPIVGMKSWPTFSPTVIRWTIAATGSGVGLDAVGRRMDVCPGRRSSERALDSPHADTVSAAAATAAMAGTDFPRGSRRTGTTVTSRPADGKHG